MEINEFKKIITGQFVIIDTNILIEAFPKDDYFQDFFEFLKDCNCSIVNSELVNFEFMRSGYLPEMVGPREKEKFLKKINAGDLPPKIHLLEEALEIARVYSHQGIRKGQISLVDCCIGALLRQYGKKLFLATMNHSDFPICLFDREYIFPIDAGNNVLSVAFYRFNDEKWQKLTEKLAKVNNN
jgi:predicted nucleic acid-binding protein